MELKMNKKADASMWWIIIGAVIALVVLVVLMVIFTGKTNVLEKGLSECEGKGGVCVDESGSCPLRTFVSGAFDCKNTGDKCCLGTPKECDKPGKTCDLSKEEYCQNGYCYG